MDNRSLKCPKCGGWLEPIYELWYCDTCEYVQNDEGKQVFEMLEKDKNET